MNMFFGKEKIVVLNPTLSLVEFGLARVAYAKDKEGLRVQWICNGVDGVIGTGDGIGHPDDGEEIHRVEIAEPLVLVALWTYYPEQSMTRQIRQNLFLDVAKVDPSTRVNTYEAVVTEMVKTSKKMTKSDVVSAEDTLDFDRLFLRKGMKSISNEKDAEAAKKVQEFPCYLKLIVTTDYLDILTHNRGGAPTRSMKRRKIHQNQNQGLLGILDSSNLYMFAERWLLDSVRVCWEMQS